MLFKPVGRVLLAVFVVIVVAVAWFALQVDPIFAHKSKEVIVTVHSGDSFSTVAGELHAKGVIASPFALRLESLVLGAVDLRAGTYQLRQGSSFATVRAILSRPPNVVVINATPGLTLHEIALEVASERGVDFANQFARVATNAATPSTYGDGSSLEGLVGAGTYLITGSTTPGELAKRMVDRFRREASSVGLTPTSTTEGLHAYQVITAASIVEKEGYYPRNMPKVARVILNRLARGGPLQMDSTVLYALGRDGGTVTGADLKTVSPYNTYLNKGLPPTPTCFPSEDALVAALQPPAGSWLYFVVVAQDGTEAFSDTYAGQQANEALAGQRGLG